MVSRPFLVPFWCVPAQRANKKLKQLANRRKFAMGKVQFAPELASETGRIVFAIPSLGTNLGRQRSFRGPRAHARVEKGV